MFEQPNMIIRRTCKQYGVPLWVLAQRLGMSEITLIRKMRIEFSDSRKKELLNMIYDIAEVHRKGSM